jgi:23S rRNA U2552 (ribose-2'-O)-methylase RlmE/FtsJ
MEKLFNNDEYKKYIELKKKLKNRSVYDKFDKYEYINSLYNEHYLQMLDMDNKKNFVGSDIVTLDLCSAPSGFSSYFIKKSSKNKGVGISLQIEKGGLPNMMNDQRYKFYYKNILDDKEDIKKIIKDYEFDLIVHGCHDMTEEKNFYKETRYAELKLWLSAFRLGITQLKKNGIYLFKITIKNVNFLFNILDLLYEYFDDFEFVKTEFMHNIRSSFFVICKTKKKNTFDRIDDILKSIDEQDRSIDDFYNKMSFVNISKEKQEEIANKIIKDVIKIQYDAIIKYNDMVNMMEKNEK